LVHLHMNFQVSNSCFSFFIVFQSLNIWYFIYVCLQILDLNLVLLLPHGTTTKGRKLNVIPPCIKLQMKQQHVHLLVARTWSLQQPDVSKSVILFGLARCTLDLSFNNCWSCLNSAIREFSMYSCYEKESARILFPKTVRLIIHQSLPKTLSSKRTFYLTWIQLK